MIAVEHASDGLLAKHRLLRSIIDTDWATRLDHKVASHVIENYVQRFGNSRASLRYLAEATNSDRSNVIASLRRLCDNGVLAVLREGKGTRPTEYGLNFLFSASGSVGTTSRENPSGSAATTSCGSVGTTSSGPSGSAATTETLLLVPLTKRLREERDIDTSAASPLPLSGALGAARAVPDEDGFARLWKAYGLKRQRAEALAAFNALPSDVDLEAMITAAAEWRAAWKEDGDAKDGRRTLASWLKRRDFECEPGRRRKAIPANALPARSKAPKATLVAPANDNAPAANVVAVRRCVEVVGCVYEESGTSSTLTLSLVDKQGAFNHVIQTSHANAGIQAKGQAELTALTAAAGLETPEESQFISRRLVYIGRPSGVTYEAA